MSRSFKGKRPACVKAWRERDRARWARSLAKADSAALSQDMVNLVIAEIVDRSLPDVPAPASDAVNIRVALALGFIVRA